MAAVFRQLSRVVAVVAVIAAAAALAAEGTSTAAVLPPYGKVYAGVTVDGSLGVVPELDAFTGPAGGKAPSVIMDHRDWAHTPDFPIDFANLVVGRGATPMLTWEPWDYTAGVNQPNYRLSPSRGAPTTRWCGAGRRRSRRGKAAHAAIRARDERQLVPVG